jgi:ferrous iron transport protein B
MPGVFALVGNPNVGKTAVFNALTGLTHTTGNYPGVTVERKHGMIALDDGEAELIDMPGLYSLAAHSPDEMIVADILLNQDPREKPIDGLIMVLDASNLERNLYLLSQLTELGKPMVVALNMMDIAIRRGILVDIDALRRQIGAPVVPTSAHKQKGIATLKKAVARLARGEAPAPQRACAFPPEHDAAVGALRDALARKRPTLGRDVPAPEAFRALVDEDGYAERRLLRTLGAGFAKELRQLRDSARQDGASLAALEAKVRYGWIRDVMRAAVKTPKTAERTRSDFIDDWLTHRLFGTVIFFGLMVLVFQSIFAGALPIMSGIEWAFAHIGALMEDALPDGMLKSLLIDGILAGVGSVVVFLPQILLLSLFIALLEDCGYMSRAAFLMDKLMSWCGLSGQSFIPMLTCFACAVPGITATRVIHNRHDRITTILVAPLMSCSARLLIYTIVISAIVPDQRFLGGLIGLQGLTLFAVYALGIAVNGPMAWIFKKTFFRGHASPFLLEMPTYKTPQLRSVFRKVYREGREFLIRAGTLIFAVTVLVWALAWFPHTPAVHQRFEAQRAALNAQPASPQRAAARQRIDHLERGNYLRDSWLGRAGHRIEPVFRPLGWDWRIATAAIAAFPAREIFIATLGTLCNLENGDEEVSNSHLRENLRTIKSANGRPLFNIPVALSVIVFFALCCQCAATLVVIRRETGHWGWSLFTFAYMTILAYAGAFIAYHGAFWLGWGPYT